MCKKNKPFWQINKLIQKYSKDCVGLCTIFYKWKIGHLVSFDCRMFWCPHPFILQPCCSLSLIYFNSLKYHCIHNQDNQLISWEVRECQRLGLSRTSLQYLEWTYLNIQQKCQNSPSYFLVTKPMSQLMFKYTSRQPKLQTNKTPSLPINF